MKKILAMLLAAVMLFSLAACGGTGDSSKPDDSADTLKVGFIFLHDENSTYDKNFIDAAKAACKNMGVEMVQKTRFPSPTRATMRLWSSSTLRAAASSSLTPSVTSPS